jgi:hypothetical protein
MHSGGVNKRTNHVFLHPREVPVREVVVDVADREGDRQEHQGAA